MLKLITAAITMLVTFSAHAKDLNDAELVYTFLADALPGVVEHAGGLSTSIYLNDLTCSFSNVRRAGAPAIESSCFGTKDDGTTVKSSGAVTDLIFGLINAGLPLDKVSESGTTYIVAKKLECMRFECKSAHPKDCADIPVSYECSAE